MSLANKFNIPPALFETIKRMNEGKEEYQAKVKALMAKRGIKSLADLSPEEKKDFFNTLDSMHKAKNEEVDLEEEPELGTVKANLMNTQQPTVQVRVFKHNTLRGDSYWVTKEVKKFKTMDQAQAYVDRINKQGVAEEIDLEEAKKPVSKDDVTKLLVKYGNNPQSAKKMVDKEFDSAVKRHPEASASKIAEVIRSVAEEVEELDELSKKTLGSYVNKADDSVRKLARTSTVGADSKQRDSIRAKIDKKIDKRLDAMTNAVKKMVNKNEEVELEESKSGYDVKYATSKTAPIKVASFNSLDQAKTFLADIKKKGSNGIISQNGKPVREEVDLDEAKSSTGYDLYHKDFSSAMQHAYDFAKKKYNIEIDPTEIDRNVAMGPRKPGSGKANAYRLLDKTGKKAIQVQVANLDNKRYELNMYKEDVDLEEEQKYYSIVHKTTKKVLSTHKNLDSAKDEHGGMDQGVRAHYYIATSTKEPKTFNMKEDVEQIDEVKVGDKVSFNHSVAAAGGRSVKKTGTVHQIDGDTVHVKVKDKYGVMTHKKKASDLMKEDAEQIDELSRKTLASYIDKAAEVAVDTTARGKEKLGKAKLNFDRSMRKYDKGLEDLSKSQETQGKKLVATGAKRLVGISAAARKLASSPKKLDSRIEDVIRKIEKYIQHQDALLGRDAIDNPDFKKAVSLLKKGQVGLAVRHAMSLDSDPRDFLLTVMQPIGSLVGKTNEEVELTESHFEIGDDVICKDSGMEGEVVKIDEPQTGKYYTVKREDGKMVKYAPDELKAEDEDEDEEDDEDEDMKEAFSPAQIDKMRQEYGKIKGIDPASDNYKKLTAMLDKLDLKTLQTLAGAKIKFVSGLAQNRVVRKMNEDVEEIEELNYSNLETRNKFSSDPQRRRIADKARVKMSGMSDKLRDAKLKNPAMKSMAKEEVEELDEISAETAKSVAQKRDLHFRKGTPTETQKRRMGRGDWRADPSLHADKARQSAEKRGAKDVYDYNKKEEVQFDEASNPQISMKRAGLSVERAKEVMRHQKEIGSIRKKREALRNSYDPSIIEAYKKMKNKKKEVTKDDNQIIKSSDKLSGKQEPIELDPELKEQKS